MRMILNFKSELGMTVALLTALSLAVAGCEDGATSGDRLEVVATTSILGDIVGEIVGENVDIEVIIGPGVDPHDFQPSARQVESIARADLVIAIGLGLEASLIDVIEAQAADSLFLGPELDPHPFLGPDPEEEAGHSTALDPHVWLDPVRMAEAVPIIVERLQALDPAIDLQTRADAYVERLSSLAAEIAQTLAPIPAESRKLVTSHDALGYFATRYDFEVVGVIVAGGSTLAEPSAADLAALVDAIETSGVRAIFTDAYNPTTLAEAVASEVDLEVEVVPLITGSLTDEAPSYVEMMMIDAQRILAALGGSG